MFDLPHAQTHAVVLPHVLALNAPGVPDVEARLAAAFGAAGAVEGLARLDATLDAPRALRDLGMPEEGIGPAAEQVLANVPEGNPVPLDRAVIEALLRAAWSGSA
jgi:alcohol dehydrogenase class IV